MARLVQRIWIVVFIGTLWLCMTGTWFGWGQSSGVGERRELAPRPKLDITFPEGLCLYLRDHFGFREWLVTLNSLIRVKGLHTSYSPNVAIGSQGFLFFTGEDALENYLGRKPMAEVEVNRWVELLERRSAWLAARGIPMVVTIAPNKETVYPEMMPSWAVRGKGPSRMDRLFEALRSRSKVAVVDLRPALTGCKSQHRTYHKTDTHWSDWGGFCAYRELLLAIRKASPVKYQRLTASSGRGSEGSWALGGRVALSSSLVPLSDADLRMGHLNLNLDLNRMSGFSSLTEPVETFAPPGALPVSTGPRDLLSTNAPLPDAPRLLLLRDSFGTTLVPFLSVHFSRVYAPNTWTLDPGVIVAEHPDVVLVEIVERRLTAPAPVDSGLGN